MFLKKVRELSWHLLELGGCVFQLSLSYKQMCSFCHICSLYL